MEATTEPMVFGLEADSGAMEAGEGGGGLRIGGVGGAAGFFVVAVAAAGFFSGALAGSDFAFVNGGFGVGFTAALAGAGLSGAFGAALTGGRGDGLGDGFGDGLTGAFAGRDFDFVKVGFGGGGFGFVNCSGFTGALTAPGLAAGFTAAGLVVGGDFANRAGVEVGGLGLRAGLAAVVVRALNASARGRQAPCWAPASHRCVKTFAHNTTTTSTTLRFNDAQSPCATASTTLALSPLLDWVHLLP